MSIKLPKLSRFQLFVHLASWVPFVWVLIDFFRDNLTVNPIQALTLRTGKYALIFLILSLSCTPLNTVFGFHQALRVRRALGLYAFLYASFHLLIFIGLDYQFDPDLLIEAIFEKKYALVGFSAFLILLSLAITSTRGWMKRLGRKWTRLYRYVYLAGVLVVVHYAWPGKSDIHVPLMSGAFVLALLIARIPPIRRSLSHLRQHRIIRTNRIIFSITGKEPIK